MPWMETDAMSERIHFVVEALQGLETMTGLCARYGVSRKTGYKWLYRFGEVGSLGALREQSRRPRRSPSRTPKEIEDRVVELRQRYGWGSRKLEVLLASAGVVVSRPTIDRILRRRGLIGERTAHRPAVQRFERSCSNELAQMDFKGHYPLAGRDCCYPLSLLDDHSRFGLALGALPSQHGHRVRVVLEGSFERYGVPEAMLMDHGNPWWSSTNGHGLTGLSVFLIRQGIRLIYSGIRHPQTQGKVERFHRTLDEWLRHHGTPRSLDGFARAFSCFLEEYNELRPHEALGLLPPAHRYRPSVRAFQPNPPPWEYPPGAEIRTLSANGCLYLGKYHFVCHALAGERVQLDRFEDRILVTYRHMHIRELDLRTGASRTILRPYGPTGHPPPNREGEGAKVLPMS